jgi:hypothetical protein
VEERLIIPNIPTDHVMIQSELKYFIGAKNVNLKCQVIGGKTSQLPTARDLSVVRPVAMVCILVGLDSEATW